MMEEYPVKQYVVALCSACVEQKGKQCHTPGCAFIRRNVAEEGWPLRDGGEFDRHLFPTLEEFRDATLSASRARVAALEEALREIGGVRLDGVGYDRKELIRVVDIARAALSSGAGEGGK